MWLFATIKAVALAAAKALQALTNAKATPAECAGMKRTTEDRGDAVNIFEAGYSRSYDVPSVWGQDMARGTAFQRLAFLIDGTWRHSWHWPTSKGNDLLDAIQASIDTEMANAKKRVYELENAQKLLLSICREVEASTVSVDE